MGPVIIVMLHILQEKPAKMLFAQWDDMVGKFTSAGSHPAFGDAVLPWIHDAREVGVNIHHIAQPAACSPGNGIIVGDKDSRMRILNAALN